MKYLFLIITGFLTAFSVRSAELTVNVQAVEGQPVNDIVVYVSSAQTALTSLVNTDALLISQKDKKFSPYIMVMQKGQAINFVNNDDITHHIYSVSGDNHFEFKIKSGVEKMTEPMTATEEIAMGCNIHDWMSGYVLVVDTPYFGKTDDKGSISFSLPSNGNYDVTVWHPQLDVNNNRISQSINVAETSTSVNVVLPKKLLPIPEQTGQDEFDFIDEY